MIKINDKEYIKYNKKITWSNFEHILKDKKIIGIAPFIQFNIDDKVLIGLEFSLSKEMLEKLKINKKININQYISDVTYEDEKGWVSLITWKYDCVITRINKVQFRLEFEILSNEFETININIVDDLELL